MYRPLVPKDPNTSGAAAAPVDRPVTCSESRPQRRARHTRDEWELKKELILQLRSTYDLKTVISLVEKRTGFQASERQYKKMLSEWGSTKNIKENEMRFLIRKAQCEERADKRGTVFLVRGTQVEQEKMERFSLRTQPDEKQQSPLQFEATPSHIEYFTPGTPYSLGELMQQDRGVFTPSSKYTLSTSQLHHKLQEDPFTAILLGSDRPAETKLILVELYPAEETQTIRSTRGTRPDRSYSLFKTSNSVGNLATSVPGSDPARRHVHQFGIISILGRGRFLSTDKLVDILRQGLSFAITLEDSGAADDMNVPEVQASGISSARGSPPRYWLESHDSSFSAHETMVAKVKQSNFLRGIMGLTKMEYSSWLHRWAKMTAEDATTVKTVVNHCFGDPFLSFPSLNLSCLLVKFETHSPSDQPFILRITMGKDTRQPVLQCSDCDEGVFMLDFNGAFGALRLQIPINSINHEYATLSDKLFAESIRTGVSVLRTKLSSVAYRNYGFRSRSPWFRCFCSGAVHQRGFKEHYIDITQELKLQRDDFEPCPEDDLVTEHFSAFPSDRRRGLVIENVDGIQSNEEHWDPDVERADDLYDIFDPHPSDNEAESNFVSRPYFANLYLPDLSN